MAHSAHFGSDRDEPAQSVDNQHFPQNSVSVNVLVIPSQNLGKLVKGAGLELLDRIKELFPLGGENFIEFFY